MKKFIYLVVAATWMLALPAMAVAQNEEPVSGEVNIPDAVDEDVQTETSVDSSISIPGLSQPIQLPNITDNAINDSDSESQPQNESGLEADVTVDVEGGDTEEADGGLGTTAGWIIAGVVVLAVLSFLFTGLRR